MRRVQHRYARAAVLPPRTALSVAFVENFFLMVVCSQLRIPLFIVRKPGMAKSLAKTIAANNLLGRRSPSQFYKAFKEVALGSG